MCLNSQIIFRQNYTTITRGKTLFRAAQRGTRRTYIFFRRVSTRQKKNRSPGKVGYCQRFFSAGSSAATPYQMCRPLRRATQPFTVTSFEVAHASPLKFRFFSLLVRKRFLIGRTGKTLCPVREGSVTFRHPGAFIILVEVFFDRAPCFFF